MMELPPWVVEAAKYGGGIVGGIVLAGFVHPLGEWSKNVPSRIASRVRGSVTSLGRGLWLGSAEEGWNVYECAKAVTLLVDGTGGMIIARDEPRFYVNVRVINRSPFPLRVTLHRAYIESQSWGTIIDCAKTDTLDLPSEMLSHGFLADLGTPVRLEGPIDLVSMAQIKQSVSNVDPSVRMIPYGATIKLDVFVEGKCGAAKATIRTLTLLTLSR
jgi:hypothetical protein